MAVKSCNTCRLDKKFSSEFFRPRKNGTLSPTCRKCAYKTSAKWQKANAARRRVTQQNWQSQHKEKVRNYWRKYKYALTSSQFEQLLQYQNYCCAICDLKFTCDSRNTTPHIDHAHDQTRRVRGLLCGNCNSGIGKLGDDFSRLLRAADYLRRADCGI